MSYMIKELYKAIEDNLVTIQDISETYKVSPRTVNRWLTKVAKPKLEIQYSLTKLLESGQIQTISEAFRKEELRLRMQVDSMLMGLRESFYRWGKYSTRNEALEDLFKLLLVQIFLVKNKQKGINEFIEQGNSTINTKKLIAYINNSLLSVLGDYTKLHITNGDYKISISEDQNSLLVEVSQEFNKIDWNKISSLKRLDLFNEIFGKFLANSFSDEKEMGQYLTPIEMTRFMVKMAIQNLSKPELELLTDPERCKDFGYILDPSCGAGSFLVEVIHQLLPIVINVHGENEAAKWIENMGKYVLCGFDKSNRMLRLTIYNFCSIGIPCENIFSLNSLDINNNKDILIEKFEQKVRLILTNPPFGAEFNGNALLKYDIFKTWSTKPPKKIDSEILFIERYINWLMNGGYCVSVVPDSILTNRGLFQDLRNGIHPFIELKAVVSFPPETFSAAGTSTKTSVICFVKDSKQSTQTYFGICKNIGFKVITKGSNKVKVSTEPSDLDAILLELEGNTQIFKYGRMVYFEDSFHRWDANYHASLSEQEFNKIVETSKEFVKVSEVASLINDRVDPRRIFKEFRYIEISDIQSSGIVYSKFVPAISAPSRARKQIRLDDVLASTVRPEQKKVGYVTSQLDDEAICTTGLAVLRPKNIKPSLLVELLKSDFVTKQLMRNNIGIAYPAVDENCFLDILLPIKRRDLIELNKEASEIEELKVKFFAQENNYKERVRKLSSAWIEQNELC